MLDKSKKKRTDGKDESCPQNSSQIYFAVPGNDAVEVGEMATTDHGGTNGGLHDDGQRTDYLQVAWLLREKLSDLLDGDKGEFPELGLRSLLDMAASRNIVSVDPKMLYPVLWRTLPKELLPLVFAYLPVPDIIRLRSLSREWKRDMATVNSGINKALDEASSTMVAGFSRLDIMCEGFPFPKFLVTICTQSSQYSYRLRPGNFVPGENLWDHTGAHDAGLVCFVSTWKLSKAKPLRIVVVNLLSRVQRKLPPLQYAYLTPPKMMHIEVDSETKCYRVVVVGKNMKGHPTVETYHSGAKQWTKVTPPLGFIFGVAHKWEYFKRYWSFRSTSPTPSVYDSNSRVLMTFPSDGRSRLMWDLKLMTFWKDCKFVLKRNYRDYDGTFQAEGHCITKYRMQTDAQNWVQERSYLCSPFEDLLGEDFLRKWTLKACEGFVMVFPYSDYSSASHCGHFWLLDLAKGEWSSLPNCFQRHEHNFLISRAYWNVMP